MTNLKDIVSYLIFFSGIACTMSIFISLIKLLLNSEESPVYIKRIKNSLIALVLVLTIVNIVNVTQRYFSSISSDGDFGIGKLPSDVEIATIDDTFKDSSKDKDGREVVFINGYKFIVINTRPLYISEYNNGFTLGTLNNSQIITGYVLDNNLHLTNIYVDELVSYIDGQGFWSGLKSDIKVLRVHKDEYNNNKNKDVDEYTKPFDERGNSANAGKLVLNMLETNDGITLNEHQIYNLIKQYGLAAGDISDLKYPY